MLWCSSVIAHRRTTKSQTRNPIVNLPGAACQAELSKLQADTGACQLATIYAQWGQRAKALEWLETALRLRDAGLEGVKTDPLLDPLRNAPRFQAIKRELKFPTSELGGSRPDWIPESRRSRGTTPGQFRP
jgi:hypothetical protein